MQSDNDGFTPEKLAKYNEEHLNGILLINDDLRNYANSRVFLDDAKALFNRIENATKAEILRQNQETQETQETHSRPKEYHDDCR